MSPRNWASLPLSLRQKGTGKRCLSNAGRLWEVCCGPTMHGTRTVGVHSSPSTPPAPEHPPQRLQLSRGFSVCAPGPRYPLSVATAQARGSADPEQQSGSHMSPLLFPTHFSHCLSRCWGDSASPAPSSMIARGRTCWLASVHPSAGTARWAVLSARPLQVSP